MHSSRMRTGRSLTFCRSLLPRGGCVLLGGRMLPRGEVHVSRGGGACFWGGGCASQGRLLWGCMFPGGCMLPRGACFPGGACFQEGVCASRGGVGGGIPACTEADPPVNRITHTSKNITLATTSLRPVNIIQIQLFSQAQF